MTRQQASFRVRGPVEIRGLLEQHRVMCVLFEQKHSTDPKKLVVSRGREAGVTRSTASSFAINDI